MMMMIHFRVRFMDDWFGSGLTAVINPNNDFKWW